MLHRRAGRDPGSRAAKSLHARARCAAATGTRRPLGSPTSVSQIVGRDTAQLMQAGVAAAAIESLAESFNEASLRRRSGSSVGGLPGLFAYKALNTADSSSAIASRVGALRLGGRPRGRLGQSHSRALAGLLIVIAGGGGLRVMWRDAPRTHRPMPVGPRRRWRARCGIELGGAATYEGVLHERPLFGAGRRPECGDLRRAMQIYLEACALLWMLALALAIGGCCGRADDSGLRLGRRQVAAGRGAVPAAHQSRQERASLQAAEHVEQRRSHRQWR